MVRFRYRSRGRDQEAHWEIDVPAGRLLARNRYASDLGYVDPNRRRRDIEVDDETVEEEPAAPAPRRRARRVAAARVEPQAKPVVKRTTNQAAPAPPATRARTAARRAAPVARPARPARPAKAAKATKGAKARPAKTAKATPAKTTPAKTTPAKTTPAKTTPRRRPAKAAPASEAGPAAGTGGVRQAVAQVSTARVAASLASADRAPWAAATRRAARPAPTLAPPPAQTRRAPRRPVTVEADGEDRRDGPQNVPAFQPRPLPAGGDVPVAQRVRRVSVPRTPRSTDEAPAVTLPAPRRPVPPQEPMPVERGKRRRLRSR
jgi:hypothetical protein